MEQPPAADIPESELQHVAFTPVPPIGPGLATYEGTYTNAEGQRFLLTVASPADGEALAQYREELLVAFRARPPEGEEETQPGKRSGRTRQPLAQLIEKDEGKRHEEEPSEPPIGLDVSCDSLPGCGEQSQGRRLVTVEGRIDPGIAGGQRHCYRGPDRVIASVSSGSVTLGGLSAYPNPVDVPPTRNRDANRACWVRGEAGWSHYDLNSWWYEVNC